MYRRVGSRDVAWDEGGWEAKRKTSKRAGWFWRNYGHRATLGNSENGGTRGTHRSPGCHRAGNDECLQRCEESQPPTFENLKSLLSRLRVVVDLAMAFEKVCSVTVGSEVCVATECSRSAFWVFCPLTKAQVRRFVLGSMSHNLGYHSRFQVVGFASNDGDAQCDGRSYHVIHPGYALMTSSCISRNINERLVEEVRESFC